MTRDIRGRSDQCGIGNLPDLDHIVRDETMTSLDQLQSSLALADAALAHDQDAFTVYVDQHPVNGDARSKLHIQPAQDLRDKRAGLPVCCKDRNVILHRQFQHIRLRNGLGRIDDSRDLGCEQLLIDHTLSLAGERLQVCVFNITDDLQPVCVKIIEIACQLQRRPVDLGRCQRLALQIDLGRLIGQIHLICQFLNRHAGLCIHVILRSVKCALHLIVSRV